MMFVKRWVMLVVAVVLVASAGAWAQPYSIEWGEELDEIVDREWDTARGGKVSENLRDWESVGSTEELRAHRAFWSYTVEEEFLERDAFVVFTGHKRHGLMSVVILFRDDESGRLSPNLPRGIVERYGRKYGEPTETTFRDGPVNIWETEEVRIEVYAGSKMFGAHAGVDYRTWRYVEMVENAPRPEDDEI